ncbi:MAG: type II toxin-antitoxin system RelE/ParE family toxin [Cellvibrionaceae bacterium]|nr:type II toxin-antitoxin system RelE/ParE family toxin [Cellvibrionaceae bacterium]
MVKPVRPRRLIVYSDRQGNEPYTHWINTLKDKLGQRRIRSRLRRLEAGLFGDCESVGNGVSELRLFFGPGYRVYFGEDDDNIVILLCGGDKSTQDRDSKTAKSYWRAYKDNG